MFSLFFIFSHLLNIWLTNHQNLTKLFEARAQSDDITLASMKRSVMDAVIVSALQDDRSMEINSQPDDFLNCALCATREHQSTFKANENLKVHIWQSWGVFEFFCSAGV